jgi:hypothetical protein
VRFELDLTPMADDKPGMFTGERVLTRDIADDHRARGARRLMTRNGNEKCKPLRRILPRFPGVSHLEDSV